VVVFNKATRDIDDKALLKGSGLRFSHFQRFFKITITNQKWCCFLFSGVAEAIFRWKRASELSQSNVQLNLLTLVLKMFKICQLYGDASSEEQ
jgi:hypothetical protein